MKITIDIEAKEIAELRALTLPDEQLFDSKIATPRNSLSTKLQTQ